MRTLASAAFLGLATLCGLGKTAWAAASGVVPPQSSLRFVLVSERGKPLSLAETPFVCVVDEDGETTVARDVDGQQGVLEVRYLVPGRYWAVVGIAHFERVVRELSIEPGAQEERFELKALPLTGRSLDMRGGRNGPTEWTESGATGRIRLFGRFISASGADLTTHFVVCGKETGFHGSEGDLPPGLFDFTLRTRGLGRIEVTASGHAPTGIDVDLSADVDIDLGSFALLPALPVTVRLEVPAGATFDGVSWRYATRAGLERTGWSWSQRTKEREAVLELGPEPYVVGAFVRIAKQNWQSPLVVVDPRSVGEAVTLRLQRDVPFVIEPTELHEAVELQVLDERGSLVRRDRAFVDLPHRSELIPGRYTLRHRTSAAEPFREQPLEVGASLLRVTLAR